MAGDGCGRSSFAVISGGISSLADIRGGISPLAGKRGGRSSLAGKRGGISSLAGTRGGISLVSIADPFSLAGERGGIFSLVDVSESMFLLVSGGTDSSVADDLEVEAEADISSVILTALPDDIKMSAKLFLSESNMSTVIWYLSTVRSLASTPFSALHARAYSQSNI